MLFRLRLGFWILSLRFGYQFCSTIRRLRAVLARLLSLVTTRRLQWRFHPFFLVCSTYTLTWIQSMIFGLHLLIWLIYIYSLDYTSPLGSLALLVLVFVSTISPGLSHSVVSGLQPHLYLVITFTCLGHCVPTVTVV